MSIELLIQNGSTIYYPVVEEGVSLTWERKGTPGKLEFTVIKDGVLNFQEGNPVKLTVNGTTMFYGFVFTKSRKANSVTIDVVAYDQLRYLKNKDTITEEGLKASDLLKRLAADFRLNLGSVEDTGYTLETIIEEDTHAQLAWYTHSEVRTEELQTHECTPHKTLRPFTHAQLGGLENKSIRKEMTDGTVHT